MTRFVVVLAVLCTACAHSPSRAPCVPREPPTPWYGDLRALAERAARVRGLELTQTFTITPLDDAAFFDRNDRNQEASRPSLEDFSRTLEVLFIKANTFNEKTGDESYRAGLGVSREAMKRVRDDQLIAFYEFDSHTLVVRQKRPLLSPSVERATLSRTVAHVIQDQQGLGTTRPTGIDEWLAWNAVLQGDAALTAILMGADFDDMSPRRAVERVRLSRTTTKDETPKALAAIPLAREVFLFPSREGERFVTDLYAAGGLNLVDAMLRSPPSTTDLILNPQRYLAGGGPRTARVGADARHLGVLLTKSLLRSCNVAGTNPIPPELVNWLGASLVDDSLERRGNGYVWLTTWDTEETARQTPNADAEEQRTSTLLVAASELRLIAECLGARREDLTTSARGVSVALTVNRIDEADHLVALPRPKMTGARFAAVTIPEPRADVAFHNPGPGRLVGPRWEHASLGLALDWASGAQLLDNPGAVLLAGAPGVMLVGAYLDERPEDGRATEFLEGLASGLAESGKLAGKPTTIRHEWKGVTKNGAKAKEATLHWGKATFVARAYPMCAGRAVFYLVGMSVDPSSDSTRTQWQDSLAFTGAAPACDR
ncbi:MAG: hypothetical protein Q8L14_36155 [Myxococcales bacterium]|nr:hypothetical protein [Myxococcales bacterium]